VSRSRRGPDRGQSTVELALALPVVVLLLLVVLQVALVARDVVLVAHAAREGARAAAIDPDPDAAREAAEAAGGLDPDRMEVEVADRGGAGSRVRVLVRYRVRTDVPLVGRFLGDRIAMTGVTMRVEGSGTNRSELGGEVP
jgi:Flp pilus assembly protein TadG